MLHRQHGLNSLVGPHWHGANVVTWLCLWAEREPDAALEMQWDERSPRCGREEHAQPRASTLLLSGGTVIPSDKALQAAACV